MVEQVFTTESERTGEMVEQLFTARREERGKIESEKRRWGERGENDETEDTTSTTCATPPDAQALSLEYKVW